MVNELLREKKKTVWWREIGVSGGNLVKLGEDKEITEQKH